MPRLLEISKDWVLGLVEQGSSSEQSAYPHAQIVTTNNQLENRTQAVKKQTANAGFS